MGMNKYKCQICGGSGSIIEKRPGFLAGHKCLDCNEGWEMLVVEERFDYPAPSDALWDGARSIWYRYRPLSDKEVEDLVSLYQTHDGAVTADVIVNWVRLGAPVYFSNREKIKLVPWEEK
jgi:hypothetical protein